MISPKLMVSIRYLSLDFGHPECPVKTYAKRHPRCLTKTSAHNITLVWLMAN